MLVEMVRPDYENFCYDNAYFTGGKTNNEELVVEGTKIVDRVDFYVEPIDGNQIVAKGATDGLIKIPFLLLGYHGKGLNYEQGTLEGVKFLQDSCNKIEKSLLDIGCDEVVKIVRMPLKIKQENGEALMGEECAFVGYFNQ